MNQKNSATKTNKPTTNQTKKKMRWIHFSHLQISMDDVHGVQAVDSFNHGLHQVASIAFCVVATLDDAVKQFAARDAGSDEKVGAKEKKW